MTGGSKSTYPYNVFEDAIDSIVGKKQENQKERKSLFDMLFSSPKDKPPASKSSGFFDMFQSSKKAPEEKKAPDEILPIESKKKESKPIIDDKTMKSITDSEAFSIKKAEVKDSYTTEQSLEVKPEEVTPEEVTPEEEVKPEEELVEDFLKTQSIFIKVIVSIYYDKNNEKYLPTKIGIRKWLFN
jgi:hypothetical protein